MSDSLLGLAIGILLVTQSACGDESIEDKKLQDAEARVAIDLRDDGGQSIERFELIVKRGKLVAFVTKQGERTVLVQPRLLSVDALESIESAIRFELTNWQFISGKHDHSAELWISYKSEHGKLNLRRPISMDSIGAVNPQLKPFCAKYFGLR